MKCRDCGIVNLMIRKSFHNIQQKVRLYGVYGVTGGSFMSTSYLVQSCCLKSSLSSRCPKLWLPYSLPAWIRRAETTRFSLDCRRFRCKRLCCKWFPYKRFQSSSKSQADLKRRHSSNSEFILLIETNEKLISLSIRLWILESGSYERLRSVCIFGGEPQWWFVLNWFEFNARFVSDFVSDLNAKL